MKNSIIAVLKDQEISKEEKYNKLLQLMNGRLNLTQIRSYQLGYSEHKLERLIYDTKKIVPISDLEIYNFNENDSITHIVSEKERKSESEEPNNHTDETPFLMALKENTEAQEGLKLREEYPFLSDPNCPSIFHQLVGEKITAWEQFAKSREFLDVLGVSEENMSDEARELKDAFEALSEEEKALQLQAYAKQAVDNFQLNKSIKEELDFYKEQGKVLGNHPALHDLKIEQEISELDEAGLVDMKVKASKNLSKAKKEVEEKGSNEAREKRIHDWGLRQKLAEARLEQEFSKN